MTPILESAFRYAQMGLAVIPLHGKEPYFEHWPELATTDTATITNWWKKEPNSNVGIATGMKSGLFVLDIDPDKGGQESLDSLVHKHGALPCLGCWIG